MEKKKSSKTLSRYRFQFNDLEVDQDLERKVNLRLAQFLAIAPPGATAVGVVNHDGRFYTAAIEVTSPYRTFFEKAGGVTLQSAVNRALEKVEDSLYRWRYGGGQSGSMEGSSHRFNHPQPQG